MVKAVERHTGTLGSASAFAIGSCERGASQTEHLGRWPPPLSSSLSGSPNRNTLGLLRRNAKQLIIMGALAFEGEMEPEARG